MRECENQTLQLSEEATTDQHRRNLALSLNRQRQALRGVKSKISSLEEMKESCKDDIEHAKVEGDSDTIARLKVFSFDFLGLSDLHT